MALQKVMVDHFGADNLDLLINLQEFQNSFSQDSQKAFAVKLFNSVDDYGTGLLDIDALRERLRQIDSMSDKERLQFILELGNESGFISYVDLKESLRVWASCSNEAQTVVRHMTKLSRDLKESLRVDEILREVQEIRTSLSRKLNSTTDVIDDTSVSSCHPPCANIRSPVTYVKYNQRKIIFMFIYALLNAALVVNTVFIYLHDSVFHIIARACGAALHINTSFLIVLMLRHTLTYLRSTRWAKYLPIDQHVHLHKILGVGIFLLSVVHGVSHTVDVAISLRNSTMMTMFEYLLTTRSGVGYFYSTAYPIGWITMAVLLIITILSIFPCIRQKHFQVFYTTHRLYLIFLIGFLLHVPDFWKWFLIPGIILCVEKLWCSSDVSRSFRYYKSYLTNTSLLPNGVTRLTLDRPDRFHYHPGDYVYLQIPSLSRFEWHPFSISSSPENKDTLIFHIRNSGDWTKRIEKLCARSSCLKDQSDPILRLCPSSIERGIASETPVDFARDNPGFVGGNEENNLDNNEPACSLEIEDSFHHEFVYIDGPYGTSTRRLFDTEHVVLIGAGIGVTPYVSVLQSVLNCYKRQVVAKSRQCDDIWTIHTENKYSKLKKIDFVWINRDTGNLKWFGNLLSDLTDHQSMYKNSPRGPLIDARIFVTSDLYDHPAASNVTSGRPDWAKLFDEFKKEGFRKIKVCYCGPEPLAKKLKVHCMNYKYTFRKEIF